MRYVEISTQAELDALGPNEIAVVRSGRFIAWDSSHVDARDSSHVDAWGSSHVVARDSSHVVAWGSSHVVAWDSSHVDARGSSHVVAWGSSHVDAWDSSHVVAWGSSHVDARGSSHVDARGSSHVVAWGSSHVDAAKFVSVHRLAKSADIRGGVVIDVTAIVTPQDWCDLYGIEPAEGKAVLFKAVDEKGTGGNGYSRTPYVVGKTRRAPDWDPHPGCGNGLHLSPHPRMAKTYNPSAVRYLACEVDLATLVMIGDKVKVPSCRVLHEVDIDGKPVAS